MARFILRLDGTRALADRDWHGFDAVDPQKMGRFRHYVRTLPHPEDIRYLLVQTDDDGRSHQPLATFRVLPKDFSAKLYPVYRWVGRSYVVDGVTVPPKDGVAAVGTPTETTIPVQPALAEYDPSSPASATEVVALPAAAPAAPPPAAALAPPAQTFDAPETEITAVSTPQQASDEPVSPSSQLKPDAQDGLGEAVVELLEARHAESQGFLTNKELRMALERYAMDAARKHFESLGFLVEDHSKSQPYDLCCRRIHEVKYVEVKGTQTEGRAVFLTAGEVAFARENKPQTALFVLHSIQVINREDGFVLAGGKVKLIEPWNVEEGELKPVSFRYEVPLSGVCR